MNATDRDAMLLEINEHDTDLRLRFLAAHAAEPTRPWPEIEDEITQKFRKRYLDIFKKYNPETL